MGWGGGAVAVAYCMRICAQCICATTSSVRNFFSFWFFTARLLKCNPPGGATAASRKLLFFFPEQPENKLASKTLFIYFAIWTLEYNTASCGVSVISRPPEGSDVTGPLPLRWVLITVLEKLPPVNTVRLKLRPKLITGSPETVRQ